MVGVVVTIIFATVCLHGVADAFFLQFLKADPMALAKELIYNANCEISNNNLERVPIPDTETPGEGDKAIKLMNGRFGVLSTILLKGDQQVFKRVVADDKTEFQFDLNIGLGEMGMEYNFTYDAPDSASVTGLVRFSNDDTSLRMTGKLTPKSTTDCEAELEQTLLSAVQGLEASVTTSTVSPSLPKVISGLTEIGKDKIVKIFKEKVNEIISYLVAGSKSDSKFSQMLCKPFKI